MFVGVFEHLPKKRSMRLEGVAKRKFGLYFCEKSNWKQYEELEMSLVMFTVADVLSDSSYGDGGNIYDDPYGNI